MTEASYFGATGLTHASLSNKIALMPQEYDFPAIFDRCGPGNGKLRSRKSWYWKYSRYEIPDFDLLFAIESC